MTSAASGDPLRSASRGRGVVATWPHAWQVVLSATSVRCVVASVLLHCSHRVIMLHLDVVGAAPL